MKEYENYLYEKGYRKNTIDRQIKEVSRFEKWLAVQNKALVDADYSIVLAYLGHRQLSSISEATIRNYLVSLKNYYGYLESIKAIAVNPIHYLKLRKKNGVIASNNLLVDIMSKSELEESYQIYCTNQRLLMRNKVLLGLHVFQGIQSGEEQRLQVKDIDLVSASIYLKGSTRIEARKLSLDARQILFLQQWIQGKSATTYLFKYESDNQVRNVRTNLVHQLNIELARKGKRWKVDNLIHIRRSVLVNWLKEQSLRKVQYMAGHRWISSTERYLRANISELQQAIVLYHPLNTQK